MEDDSWTIIKAVVLTKTQIIDGWWFADVWVRGGLRRSWKLIQHGFSGFMGRGNKLSLRAWCPCHRHLHRRLIKRSILRQYQMISHVSLTKGVAMRSRVVLASPDTGMAFPLELQHEHHQKLSIVKPQLSRCEELLRCVQGCISRIVASNLWTIPPHLQQERCEPSWQNQ